MSLVSVSCCCFACFRRRFCFVFDFTFPRHDGPFVVVPPSPSPSIGSHSRHSSHSSPIEPLIPSSSSIVLVVPLHFLDRTSLVVCSVSFSRYSNCFRSFPMMHSPRFVDILSSGFEHFEHLLTMDLNPLTLIWRGTQTTTFPPSLVLNTT